MLRKQIKRKGKQFGTCVHFIWWNIRKTTRFQEPDRFTFKHLIIQSVLTMVEEVKNQRCVRWIMSCLCAVGFVLSYYAYYVETSKEKDENYKAMCDISEHMSCSAVFTSRFGKGFGFLNLFFGENSILYQPNSVYGMLFYASIALLAQSSSTSLLLMETIGLIVSCISSLYLAYILYFILYDFCVVCVSTYVINALLLTCSLYKLNSVAGVLKNKTA